DKVVKVGPLNLIDNGHEASQTYPCLFPPASGLSGSEPSARSPLGCPDPLQQCLKIVLQVQPVTVDGVGGSLELPGPIPIPKRRRGNPEESGSFLDGQVIAEVLRGRLGHQSANLGKRYQTLQRVTDKCSPVKGGLATPTADVDHSADAGLTEPGF